eukprot:261011_1
MASSTENPIQSTIIFMLIHILVCNSTGVNNMIQSYNYVQFLQNVACTAAKSYENKTNDEQSYNLHGYMTLNDENSRQYSIALHNIGTLSVKFYPKKETLMLFTKFGTEVEMDFTSRTAEILFIARSNTIRGTEIMLVMNKIFLDFGMVTAELEDKSEINLINDKFYDDTVHLFFVRLTQNKFNSWYANFGYYNEYRDYYIQLYMKIIYYYPFQGSTVGRTLYKLLRSGEKQQFKEICDYISDGDNDPELHMYIEEVRTFLEEMRTKTFPMNNAAQINVFRDGPFFCSSM